MNDDETRDTGTLDEDLDEMTEEASERALATEELPSEGLLSFYDRLRTRITDAVERRGNRFEKGTVEALLLVPDIFMLLVRLMLDREVPSSTRALIGGALAYFLLPIDLLPEALVGVGGFVDDLVLAVVLLSRVMDDEVEEKAELYWSGSDRIRVVLADVVGAAESLLGEDLYARLEALLAKRGIDVEEAEQSA